VIYERIVSVGLHGCSAGPVERPLGEAALARGDLDRVEAHFQLAMQRASGMPIWIAWCRLLDAETLVRRGKRGDHSLAVAQLSNALRVARERDLGFLTAWGARISERLAPQAMQSIRSQP